LQVNVELNGFASLAIDDVTTLIQLHAPEPLHVPPPPQVAVLGALL
jgi:hypothetical protein